MWTEEELRDVLSDHVCTVTFTKVDGEERIMVCTLIPSYFPEFKGSDAVYREGVVRVWDTEKEAWRSFRVDSVKSVIY